MIVKCLTNLSKDLPTDNLRNRYQFGHKFHLTIEKNYIVYSMIVSSAYVWYAVCRNHNDSYPFFYPAPLFSMVSGQISRYWSFSYAEEENGLAQNAIWAYPEWANDPYYYGELVDGEEREVQIFKKYKALMDLEFPDPFIFDKATYLEDNWLLCPFCIDAWETTSKDGMVICPMCQRVMHNPRYEDKLPQLEKAFNAYQLISS